MSDRFEIITTVCHGKDNEIVEELQSHISKSLVFDPHTGDWYLGEWSEGTSETVELPDGLDDPEGVKLEHES